MLRRQVAIYESEDPIAGMKKRYDDRIRQKDSTIQTCKNGWHACLEKLKECQKELTAERKKTAEADRRANKAEKENEQLRAQAAEQAKQIETLTQRVEELEAQLSKANAKLDRNGTNTGIPTGMTPINQAKRIPVVNLRQQTDRHVGGQEGHEKKTLQPFSDEDVTETVPLEFDPGPEAKCSACGGKLTPTDPVIKYVYDICVKVIRRKIVAEAYKCEDCGKVFTALKGTLTKTDVTYGPELQALILALMASDNVPVNKVASFIEGISNGEIKPSEGYISKRMKKAAEGLKGFKEDLRQLLIGQRVIHWDDTVPLIDTKRACLRFYGNDNISYYTAHMSKNMKGLDDDGILDSLTEDQYVVHDHNLVNYNKKYHFQNVECGQHFLRDLQKNTDDTGHQWSKDLAEKIRTMMDRRKELIAQGIESLSKEEYEKFLAEIDECIERGVQENRQLREKIKDLKGADYGAGFERSLLHRFGKTIGDEKKGEDYDVDDVDDEDDMPNEDAAKAQALAGRRNYLENYLAWVRDFSLPDTNNLAERGLRCIKSHLKISGQFKSINTCCNYADVKTYIETCRKNGINEFDALTRLCDGNPYTVKEVFDSERHHEEEN